MTQPSAFFNYFSYFRKDNRTGLSCLVEVELFLIEVELFLVEVELFLIEVELLGRG